MLLILIQTSNSEVNTLKHGVWKGILVGEGEKDFQMYAFFLNKAFIFTAKWLCQHLLSPEYTH